MILEVEKEKSKMEDGKFVKRGFFLSIVITLLVFFCALGIQYLQFLESSVNQQYSGSVIRFIFSFGPGFLSSIIIASAVLIALLTTLLYPTLRKLEDAKEVIESEGQNLIERSNELQESRKKITEHTDILVGHAASLSKAVLGSSQLEDLIVAKKIDPYSIKKLLEGYGNYRISYSNLIDEFIKVQGLDEDSALIQYRIKALISMLYSYHLEESYDFYQKEIITNSENYVVMISTLFQEAHLLSNDTK